MLLLPTKLALTQLPFPLLLKMMPINPGPRVTTSGARGRTLKLPVHTGLSLISSGLQHWRPQRLRPCRAGYQLPLWHAQRHHASDGFPNLACRNFTFKITISRCEKHQFGCQGKEYSNRLYNFLISLLPLSVAQRASTQRKPWHLAFASSAVANVQVRGDGLGDKQPPRRPPKRARLASVPA